MSKHQMVAVGPVLPQLCYICCITEQILYKTYPWYFVNCLLQVIAKVVFFSLFGI